MKMIKIQNDYLRLWMDFIWTMTEKEIKARYKHAFFGFLWMFLNPILQMIVIGTVFRFFAPMRTENYYLYLIVGLITWNFFSYSVTKSTSAIVFERMLIQKAKFPREGIILSIVLSNWIHAVLSMGIILLVSFIWITWSQVVWWIMIGKAFLLVASLLLLFLFTIGISLCTAALNVRFRDVNFFVQAFIPLLFYATPIMYERHSLPLLLQHFLQLNPLTVIVEWQHFVFSHLPLPTLGESLWSIIMILFVFSGGSLLFYSQSKTFDDWL